MNQRPQKKTDSVEVRLSPEAKAAFMARCRAEGSTVSDVIRRFIETESTRPTRPTNRRSLGAAVLAGLALGAVAAPSLAQGVAPGRLVFDQLDRDRDGVLSFDEFRAR